MFAHGGNGGSEPALFGKSHSLATAGAWSDDEARFAVEAFCRRHGAHDLKSFVALGQDGFARAFALEGVELTLKHRSLVRQAFAKAQEELARSPGGQAAEAPSGTQSDCEEAGLLGVDPVDHILHEEVQSSSPRRKDAAPPNFCFKCVVLSLAQICLFAVLFVVVLSVGKGSSLTDVATSAAQPVMESTLSAAQPVLESSGAQRVVNYAIGAPDARAAPQSHSTSPTQEERTETSGSADHPAPGNVAPTVTAPETAAKTVQPQGNVLTPFLPAVEPEVKYDLPRNEMPRDKRNANTPWMGRKNVIWMHLHNYGGTTMCAKAEAHGEKVPTKNCCWPGDGVTGRGWGTPFAHHARCNERSNDKRITFSMIERGLEPGDLCHDSILGTMLRNPFKGARSTVMYHGYSRSDKRAIFDAIRNKKPLKMGSHNGLPHWDNVPHFDNFMTRSLSGSYMVDPGMVTREQMELAKALLPKFDVVMLLEELDEHMDQAKVFFNWKVEGRAPKLNGHSEEQYRAAMSEEEEKEFKELNTLDFELWEYGKTVAAQKLSEARAKLAR